MACALKTPLAHQLLMIDEGDAYLESRRRLHGQHTPGDMEQPLTSIDCIAIIPHTLSRSIATH